MKHHVTLVRMLFCSKRLVTGTFKRVSPADAKARTSKAEAGEAASQIMQPVAQMVLSEVLDKPMVSEVLRQSVALSHMRRI